jgi:mRNA interferase MazF
MKHGSIWLVNFTPSQGHEYQDTRPALVVQSNTSLQKTSLVTVAPLTSNTGNKMSYDILVASTQENGLFKDSVLKVGCISSFDKSRFKKKLGVIEGDIIIQLKKYLRIHFEI